MIRAGLRLFALTLLAVIPMIAHSADWTRWLLEEWSALDRSGRTLSRQERTAQMDAFLDGLDLEDLRRVCIDAGQPEDRQEVSRIRTFSHAVASRKLSLGEDLTGLLGDPDIGPHCRQSVLQILNRNRDRLDPATRDAIGDTLMWIVDHPATDPGARRQHERTAASFSASDRVRDRIVEHLSSAIDSVRVQGALMAAVSPDPRTADLLEVALREAERQPDRYLESFRTIAHAAARRVGPAVLPTLEAVVWKHREWSVRSVGLEAIGMVPHMLSGRMLERVYREYSADVADSTWTLPPGPARDLHVTLHRAVRSLEVTLRDALEHGSRDDAEVALRLLDRTSRFGPAVQPDLVQRALSRAQERFEGFGERLDMRALEHRLATRRDGI